MNTTSLPMLLGRADGILQEGTRWKVVDVGHLHRS